MTQRQLHFFFIRVSTPLNCCYPPDSPIQSSSVSFYFTMTCKKYLFFSCQRGLSLLCSKKRLNIRSNGKEKTSTCAVSALLRTRIVQGCLRPGFWIPLRFRWACKRRYAILAPSGYSIGSSKARLITNTAEVCRTESYTAIFSIPPFPLQYTRAPFSLR